MQYAFCHALFILFFGTVGRKEKIQDFYSELLLSAEP